jgi:hypothetical protein
MHLHRRGPNGQIPVELTSCAEDGSKVQLQYQPPARELEAKDVCIFSEVALLSDMDV